MLRSFDGHVVQSVSQAGTSPGPTVHTPTSVGRYCFGIPRAVMMVTDRYATSSEMKSPI